MALRRLRMSAAEIVEMLEMPLSTVSAVLKRIGVGKLGRIGLEPAVRYERTHAFSCRKLGFRLLRTRPYRPETNGKVERFIPTLLA